MQYVELKDIAKAIEHLRTQIPAADSQMRQEMRDQLIALRDMAGSILDAWMEVDDAIEETVRELGDSSPETAPTISYGDSEKVNLSAVDEPLTDAVTDRQPHWLTGPMELTEAWYDLSLKAETALRRGLGYFDLEMFEEAADALTDAVSENDTPATRIYLSLSHMASGQLQEAATELTEARRMAQDEVTLQAILEAEIQMFALGDDWHSAIHTLYELLTFHPNQGDTWYNIGICHMHLHEFAAAERCLAHAMMFDENDEEAYLWRAFTLCMTDRQIEAKRLLEWLPSDNAGHHELRAVVLLATGNVEHALLSARHVVSHKSGALIGLCQLVRGEIRKATTTLKRHLTICPDNAEGKMLFGICSFLSGDFTRSKQALRELMSTTPTNTLVELLLARLDAMDGYSDEAQQRFERLVNHPRLPIRRLAVLYRGMLYTSEGREDLAKTDFVYARSLGFSNEIVNIAEVTAKSLKLKIT